MEGKEESLISKEGVSPFCSLAEITFSQRKKGQEWGRRAENALHLPMLKRPLSSVTLTDPYLRKGRRLEDFEWDSTD